MRECPRIGKYRKNEKQEAFLSKLNRTLAPFERELTDHLNEPKRPVLFIIGPPRSGTTLVSQLLAHWGSFGYVSNFLARFWLAPKIGAMIESALNLGSSGAPEYSSEYGVTQGWSEPHEFGYFWNRWFDFGQETHKLSAPQLEDVDRVGLKRSIAAIEEVYEKPMVFKNNTWCTFQVEFLAGTFPKAIFIVCERDPVFTAQSILIGREERLGRKDLWWSVRPRQYGSLLERPWWDQIAGQVYYTVRDMEEGLCSIDRDRVVRVGYRELCGKPYEIARRIATAANRLGAGVSEDGHAPEPFTPRDIRRVSDQDFERLRRAIGHYFALNRMQ